MFDDNHAISFSTLDMKKLYVMNDCGCSDPITLASLQPGRTVLGLGSGAGLDCFFAAKKVGETGHVIGVYRTLEMIERAWSSAERLDSGNVEFRQGFLEELPVDSNSVDVIISN